jgi:hypothetical protein
MNAAASLTPEKIAKLEKMMDRQEILDVLTRVSRGIDRFDRDLFVSSFHDDALIDSGAYVNAPGTVYDGAGRGGHEEGQSATLHNILNHSCDLQGDTAHTETYFYFCGANKDGTNWLAGGRYLDRFERRNGAWKIAFRYTILEWSSVVPGVIVPLFENVADLRMNGTPQRSKDDPSYRRPLANKRKVQSHSNPKELGAPHN